MNLRDMIAARSGGRSQCVFRTVARFANDLACNVAKAKEFASAVPSVPVKVNLYLSVFRVIYRAKPLP